ncbi:mitochondrial fission protein ELM1 [Marinicella litoralis]|uniref:Mitochondrial fission protein ELM1 n=2 Tax=Marinicella litoralis TaxID=644220 RepID=A0A4R6XJB0_9GAMM|nr:mitochondrial fission protein ELM1 [Marinicella litoralis]
MTLAHALSSNLQKFQFSLKQPWVTFAPRRMPQFKLALNWHGTQPSLPDKPKLLITTGRKAAAVGKHILDQLKQHNHNCLHLQILNPKDNFKKYDLLLAPQHDNIKGPNVITFHGSIHPYNHQWFQADCPELGSYMAIIIGNPKPAYFASQFFEEISLIRSKFPNNPLYFCGSPRLDERSKTLIFSAAKTTDRLWLDPAHGNNPYQSLLKNAKKLFITADSINMINESCQSAAPVSILANQFTASPKHQRFIQSIQTRLCALDSLDTGKPSAYALDQITVHPLLISTLIAAINK